MISWLKTVIIIENPIVSCCIYITSDLHMLWYSQEEPSSHVAVSSYDRLRTNMATALNSIWFQHLSWNSGHGNVDATQRFKVTCLGPSWRHYSILFCHLLSLFSKHKVLPNFQNGVKMSDILQTVTDGHTTSKFSWCANETYLTKKV